MPRRFNSLPDRYEHFRRDLLITEAVLLGERSTHLSKQHDLSPQAVLKAVRRTLSRLAAEARLNALAAGADLDTIPEIDETATLRQLRERQNECLRLVRAYLPPPTRW